MKKSIFVFVLISSLFFSCALSESKLENRLKKFYTFVNDKEIIDDFQKGDLDNVSLAISNQLHSSDDVVVKKQKLKLLQQEEWIDFFSIEQTVDYYYYTFYLPIQKKKKSSDSKN